MGPGSAVRRRPLQAVVESVSVFLALAGTVPTMTEARNHAAPMPVPTPPTSLTRVRFPVADLQYGMYVAELDRPWLDTPFLLEGLLLRDAAELAMLRRHCQFAYVDLERSTGSVADAIRAAHRKRLDATQARSRRYLSASAAAPEGMFARLRRRLARPAPAAAGPQPDPSAPAPAISDLQLPPGLKLQRYAEPVPIETALPRAIESWSRSADTLRTLMDDLRDDARADLREIDQVADEIVGSMVESPDAMLWVARMRDEHQGTYQHCLKVAIYLIALGRQLGFPREELVRLGLIGMLADVGKIRLPRALLEKPGMLTPPEFAVVKRHVQLGIEALRKSMTLDRSVEQGILQHHERLDGSGYPQGLAGKEIGIYGRMTAIADCFAALIADRPYAKGIAPQQALMQMYKWCGASFHEPLVEQFVQAIGVFPVGSLVELSSGEVAIVLAHNRVRRLEPRVLVLAGADKRALDAPFERDLLNGPSDETGHSVHIACGLPAGAHGLKPGDYYADEDATCDGPILAAA